MANLRPALFLDRDGIINLDTDFLYKIEDVVWVNGIFEVIRYAKQHGYAVIVVTNQSGIGRGYYTEEDFHLLMQWIKEQMEARECGLDGVYFSPYHPVQGIGHYKQETECRKPKPGMLLQAAREHHLNLEKSVMIGDRCSDIQAAAAAGVPMRLLLFGTESAACPDSPDYILIHSLQEAIAHIPLALK